MMVRSRRQIAGNSDSSTGCGCLVFIIVVAMALFSPRQTATVAPEMYALVVTAYHLQPEQQVNATRRVAELRQAGWSTAGYRDWKSLQDSNAFYLVYVRSFSTEAAADAFRTQHRAALGRFESLRTFRWVAERRQEDDSTFLIRILCTVLVCWLCWMAIGLPAGYVLGRLGAATGAMRDTNAGCLSWALPGLNWGYTSQKVASAKLVSWVEQRKGDVCTKRMTLAEYRQGGGR